MIYDVVVVGAGPAGAVLAYMLARRGLQVLILERAVLPRDKPCGGGLTRKAFEALPFDVGPAIGLWAAGGSVHYAGRCVFKVAVYPPVACSVVRDRFDHFLVQQAVGAGAHLVEREVVVGVEEEEGQVVIRTRGGGWWRGRLAAGADGVNSVVARSIGLLVNREVGMGMEAKIEAPSEALEAQGPYAMFDFGVLPRGYGWVFPKSDHLSVGVFQAHPGSRAPALKRYLETFIASLALEGCRLVGMRGHPIPLGGRRRRLHQGRMLLVGDAANLADPWLGEGLYYAIVSACLAAHAMEEALGGSRIDLSSYTASVHEGIVRQLACARRFARLVYRFPRATLALLKRSPLMQDAVFGVMRGDLTFWQLNRMLLMQSPRILAQASAQRMKG